MKLKILVLKTLIISTFQIYFFSFLNLLFTKKWSDFFESESPYLDCNKVIEEINSIHIKNPKKINLDFSCSQKKIYLFK